VWWDRSRRIDIYLGPSLVGCSGAPGASARWQAAAGIDDALGQLQRWIADEPGRVRARVWLASTLARPLMLAADCGAKDGREAAALASMLAQDSIGQDDEPKVWCAPWRPGRPTLAAAVSRELWTRLDQFGPARGGRRVRIDSVRPWWNQVMDAMLARSRDGAGGLGWTVSEPDGFVAGLARAGQPADVVFEQPKGHDRDWALLRRRLGASWHDVDAFAHFEFASAAPQDGATFIGSARPLAATERGA
jgi:hypothetical protein